MHSLKITKNKETFLLLAILGLIIATLGVFILPERFFYDTPVIIKDPYNEIAWVGSYPFSIMFYKITFLKHLHFSLIGIIQFSIAIYIIYKIGIPNKFNIITAKNLVTYLSFLLIGVFLSMPTKEFINFIYISIIVFLLRKKSTKKLILSLSLLVFFSYFFRPYYLIITILTIALYFSSKIKIKNKQTATIIYGLIIAIGISLSHGLIKGKFISQDTREAYNLTRLNGKANNSMIQSPLKTDTWYGESFGIVYGFFSVNLPFNGLKHFKSPQIIAFILWQLLLFIILFIRYERCLKNGIKNNFNLWGFYIVFSFFIVQGMFEPDLGSAIRHKIGLFPLLYFCLYNDEFDTY